MSSVFERGEFGSRLCLPVRTKGRLWFCMYRLKATVINYLLKIDTYNLEIILM